MEAPKEEMFFFRKYGKQQAPDPTMFSQQQQQRDISRFARTIHEMRIKKAFRKTGQNFLELFSPMASCIPHFPYQRTVKVKI